MRNYNLLIAFDGTNYSGWQRQPDAVTVEGVIEEQLRKIFQEDIDITGAGRTDAGVHALAMNANFLTTAKIPCQGLKKGLNSLLPADIRIMAVSEQDNCFHARKSAVAKTYCYYFATCENLPPSRSRFVTHLPGDYDISLMKSCLATLVGCHDFSSFEATGSRDREIVGGRGAIRTITKASLNLTSQSGEYEILLSGDGFLRKMVRNIAGTLFEVGRGRLSFNSFLDILPAKDRSFAGPTAEPQGLFLVDIEY